MRQREDSLGHLTGRAPAGPAAGRAAETSTDKGRHQGQHEQHGQQEPRGGFQQGQQGEDEWVHIDRSQGERRGRRNDRSGR